MTDLSGEQEEMVQVHRHSLAFAGTHLHLDYKELSKVEVSPRRGKLDGCQKRCNLGSHHCPGVKSQVCRSKHNLSLAD